MQISLSSCFKVALLLTFNLALVACDSGVGSKNPEPLNDFSVLPADAFFADRATLVEGEFTFLRWDVPEATNVSITPDIGDVSGVAPLTVRMTPIPDSLTAINRFYWDFEGDGGDVDGGLGEGAQGFDRLSFSARDYDVAGRDVLYTFESPGTYQPRVRVWDDTGNQAEATIDIIIGNAPPSAYLRATPTSGQAPLRVSFSIDSSDNEGVERYEWDFDGDGNYDSTTTSTRESHTYESPGSFQVGIRVTDTEGESVVLAPIHMQVDARATVAPTVVYRTRTTQGTAPLTVDFNPTVRDLTSSGIARWEWDFDGDGVIDSTEAAPISHTYDRVGNFYPKVRVTAADGSSGTDIMNIITVADHSMTLADAAINPETGDISSTINVTLAGTTDVGLVVENAGGETVRTLWPAQNRVTGDYALSWDGKADAGHVLPPGDYYVVLRYQDIDGIDHTIDYRTSTGGKIFYPSDWGGSCRGTDRGVECGVLSVSENELEPFNSQPTVYSFTNPNNARMTGYMTIIGNVDFAPATFFRSRLMPPGDYEVSWFGEGTNGKMLPRLDRGGYLPAIYGLTASDNAIYLTHQTALGDLSVEPAIVYPAGASSDNVSNLTFDLSRGSDIVLTVDSINSGVEVLRRTIPDVAAGSDVAIEWDGRGNSGELVAPGGYRISVVAIDSFGQSTLPMRAMQRIEY